MNKLLYTLLAAVTTCVISHAQTRIDIDASKKGAPVSKNLYGIFFEDINHSGEGGIYAELIENRSLEANRIPEDMRREGHHVHSNQGWKVYFPEPDSLEGWKLELSGSAKGKVSQDNTTPLNKFNLMSMKLEIENPGNQNFKISNDGFWGISVIKGDNYNLSVYLRSNAPDAQMMVMLRDEKGNIIAKDVIKGITGEWKKYSSKLNASITYPKASFVLVPLNKGTYWADMISLFPEKTYKQRENGLRYDLAKLIEDFKPGFLRFPGGCVVEGADYENRIIWKNTIGDISQRLGRWELWGYHNTDGLGYHEFLQFCEDLGTPGMYVFPVGMSCQFRRCEVVHNDSLHNYVQEALDAIEYAIGPVTSKWGAERAKNGHPAPFNLKYVEIGNENYGPIYQERYNIFIKAVKEKYPHLITIACTDPAMRGPFKRSDLSGITEPIEFIDEHFYEGLDFFFKGAYRYDNYDRQGPKIYVGEYAVKKWNNTLRGNLEAALAEAAFMTGFERNADIVELSSQAPTLVNDNDQTWNPDIIVFNSSQSYGTPSYYGQKLFSNNIPDNVLNTQVFESGHKINPVEKGVGVLSFANPQAFCRYKDFTIEIGGKKYAVNEYFTSEALKQLNNGELVVGKNEFKDMRIKSEIYQSTKDWSNYTVTLKAYADSIDDLETFQVLFFSTGKDKHYKWVLGRWLRRHFLQWYDNGYEGYFAQKPGEIITGKWYDIKIEMKNDSVFASLDGELVHAARQPERVTPGVYATAGINNDGSLILKVVNATAQTSEIPVNINNSGILYKTANIETMTGNNLDENTFTEPLKVTPVKSQKNIPGNNFKHAFPANSITIVKLK